MKPTPSIIGFTTLSGLGYGMLAVLSLGAVNGLIPADRWLGLAGLVAALGLITLGLVASTFHLGHPGRAWRAVSQWRSSWLSREGLLALITYAPALMLTIGWVGEERVTGVYGVAAVLAALGALATVGCTGMIYASLPPVKAWHQPLTTPVYLAFALMTGLLAVHCLLTLYGLFEPVIAVAAMAATAGAFFLKVLYWQAILDDSTSPTRESATGLGGGSGSVRMLDPPHTQTNYLLDEMGFQIGRKHARKLRMLTFVFGLLLPLVLTALSLVLTAGVAGILTVIALASAMIGVLIERWLFFAEAKHTVMLYYGAPADTIVRQPATAPSEVKAPDTLPRRRQPSATARRNNVRVKEPKRRERLAPAAVKKQRQAR